MKKVLLFFCLFLYFLFPVHAVLSDAELDSLERLVGDKRNQRAVKILQKVYRDAVARGDAKLIVWTWNMKARQAFEIGKFDEVLMIGTEARELTLKFKNNTFIAHLFTLMGESYTNLGFREEGQRILLEAKTYAELITDNDSRHRRLGMIFNGIARNFQPDKANADLVLYHYKKSLVEYLLIKKPECTKAAISMAENNIAGWYLDAKQLDSAKKYLDMMELVKPELRISRTEMYRFSNLGSLYFELKKYKESLSAFKKGFALADSLSDDYVKKYVYDGLSKLYKALNDYEQEKAFLEKYIVISERLAREEKKAIKTPISLLINESKKHIESKIGNYTLMLMILFPLFIVATYLFFLFFKKFKNVQMASAEQIRLTENKMTLLEDLRSPKDKNEEEEMRTVVQMAIANDPAFFIKFSKFDRKFCEKILALSPTLVASELEFCALLRLNFETKEIARYTGLSVRAVEAKKYRIRKKIKISSDEDINIWMSKL